MPLPVGVCTVLLPCQWICQKPQFSQCHFARNLYLINYNELDPGHQAKRKRKEKEEGGKEKEKERRRLCDLNAHFQSCRTWDSKWVKF